MTPVAAYLTLSLAIAIVFGSWFGLWCWGDDRQRQGRLGLSDYGVLVGSSVIVALFFLVFWPVFLAITTAALVRRVADG